MSVPMNAGVMLLTIAVTLAACGSSGPREGSRAWAEGRYRYMTTDASGNPIQPNEYLTLRQDGTWEVTGPDADTGTYAIVKDESGYWCVVDVTDAFATAGNGSSNVPDLLPEIPSTYKGDAVGEFGEFGPQGGAIGGFGTDANTGQKEFTISWAK